MKLMLLQDTREGAEAKQIVQGWFGERGPQVASIFFDKLKKPWSVTWVTSLLLVVIGGDYGLCCHSRLQQED